MIKELNEQIDRLRKVLVTCYKAIKEKGGSIPEAGERNMTNLPAAVLSIPQTHGVLKELEVTADGEYLPATYDADGFSKVIANFDTSSLQKIKVSTFSVRNNCIDENGRWRGEDLIDTSQCENFINLFYQCTAITTLDASKWDVRGVRTINTAFAGCNNLKDLDVSTWVTSSLEESGFTFSQCRELIAIDLINWDFSKVTFITSMFDYCYKLQSLIGSLTIDDVLADNNISVLKGLKVSLVLNQTILDTASILALVNGLADLTGQNAQTLTLGSTIGARLDTEEIAGVPAKEYLASKTREKNWTIAY